MAITKNMGSETVIGVLSCSMHFNAFLYVCLSSSAFMDTEKVQREIQVEKAFID